MGRDVDDLEEHGFREETAQEVPQFELFHDTKLSYQFPFGGRSEDEAVDMAVNSMMTGREGLFVLLSNRPLTASEILDLYHARNDVETAFRDPKHGIDWRPAICISEDAIRGRILISFLALFCMSVVCFLYPEFRGKTAESMCEGLNSFSLTVLVQKGMEKRRIFSNFGQIICRLWSRKESVSVPKAPEQTLINDIQA